MSVKNFPTTNGGNWLKLIFQGIVPAILLALGGWVWAIDRDITAIKANRFTATDALEMKAELMAVSTAQLDLIATLKSDHAVQQSQIADLQRDINDIQQRLRGSSR